MSAIPFPMPDVPIVGQPFTFVDWDIELKARVRCNCEAQTMISLKGQYVAQYCDACGSGAQILGLAVTPHGLGIQIEPVQQILVAES